jgi:hypothetical protein
MHALMSCRARELLYDKSTDAVVLSIMFEFRRVRNTHYNVSLPATEGMIVNSRGAVQTKSRQHSMPAKLIRVKEDFSRRDVTRASCA